MLLSPSSYWWAIECYKRNARKCPLYALPFELLVKIREYMDPIEKMCFALSSAKLFKTFSSITVPTNSIGDTQIGVYVRRLRDDFYRHVRDRSKIWCVHCADYHHASSLLGNTLSSSPWDRMCYSSLQLCPHWSLSLDSLKARIARSKVVEEGMYLDLRCSSCNSSFNATRRMFRNMVAITHEPRTREYVLRISIQINFEKERARPPIQKAVKIYEPSVLQHVYI
jgi:hypothetical protein